MHNTHKLMVRVFQVNGGVCGASTFDKHKYKHKPKPKHKHTLELESPNYMHHDFCTSHRGVAIVLDCASDILSILELVYIATDTVAVTSGMWMRGLRQSA